MFAMLTLSLALGAHSVIAQTSKSYGCGGSGATPAMVLGEFRNGGVSQDRSLQALAAVVRADNPGGAPIAWLAWDENGDPWIEPALRISSSEQSWLVQSFGGAANPRRQGDGLFRAITRSYSLNSNIQLSTCATYDFKN